MTQGAPILDTELEDIFSGLKRFRAVILAVSGGADSAALLHLAARWATMRHRQNQTTPRLHVATVDHGLRPESAREAQIVGSWAQNLQLTHACLPWHGTKPEAGLQAAARAARYEILTAYAVKLHEAPVAIAVAHTADDQAETLLMRLARGSGLDGVSAMARERSLAIEPEIRLCRPFLGIAKARLEATLQASGLSWIEDPSNQKRKYERVRMREAATTLATLGLTSEKLALSAARLSRARVALDHEVSVLQHNVLDVNGGAFANIERARLASAPEELRLRLLARVLKAFGGEAPAARLSEIEALSARIDAAGSRHVATLGGCLIEAAPDRIRVFREVGRVPLPQIVLSKGSRKLWDGRFQVSVLKSTDTPVQVRALDEATYSALTDGQKGRIPARAACTLPAFWSQSHLLAVPVLSPDERFHADFVGLPDDSRNWR